MDNWGGNVTMAYKAARRLVICPTYNGSAALNQIAVSSLDAGQLPIAVLQAKYNIWHHSADPASKFAATPQLSEFTITDVDAQESTSEWYKAIMQLGERDVAFILNDPSPFVMKQLALLTAAGQLSFYIITGDDYLLCKLDATKENLVPFQIQDGSLKVIPYKLRGYAEHSKNTISFRLNESDSMNSLVGVKITGGYVTSDLAHFSLIDCTATVTSPTTGGAVIAIKKTNSNPLTPTVDEPVTGILHTEVAAIASDGTGDEAPAAAGNWVEDPPGTYTWAETGVFTANKTYALQISHARIEVAPVNIVVPS
jgi:hypothetical protein